MPEKLTPRQRLLKTLEAARPERLEPLYGSKKPVKEKVIGEYYKITRPVY